MSAAAFPHRILVLAPNPFQGGGGGAFNAQDEWVPGESDPDGQDEETVFDSLAFVEDKGRMILRSTENSPALASDVVAFCMDTIPADMEVGLAARIFWSPGDPAGATSDARVMRVSRTDNSVDLTNV